MTTDDELDMVETSRLFDALRRRFSSVVLLTDESRRKDKDYFDFYYGGGLTAAFGLIEQGRIAAITRRRRFVYGASQSLSSFQLWLFEDAIPATARWRWFFDGFRMAGYAVWGVMFNCAAPF